MLFSIGINFSLLRDSYTEILLSLSFFTSFSMLVFAEYISKILEIFYLG